MKKLILIVMTIICLGSIGCSSLGELMTGNQALYSDAGLDPLPPVHLNMDQNESKSFQVFNNNPYALHLEFDREDLNKNQTPVNGDGGASLNAYAACLTLKVMF